MSETPAPTIAYGQRRLFRSKVFCCRVWRHQDDAFLDIGFHPDGRVDEVAERDFCGTQGPKLRVFYNQSTGELLDNNKIDAPVTDEVHTMNPDDISAIVKMRAQVLNIANELECLSETEPRQRIMDAHLMAHRLKTAIMAPAVVEACERERQLEVMSSNQTTKTTLESMSCAELPMTIPAGSTLTVSTGEHSDYLVIGVFRALKDIDPKKLADDWIIKHPDQANDHSLDGRRFLVEACRAGLIAHVPSYEWELCDHSRLSAMNVWPPAKWEPHE